MLEYGVFDISWDGGRSIRVRDNEFTLAVDPVQDSSPSFEAAIVLVTCEEGFDREKLADVCGRGTCVVLPESMDDRMVPSQDVEFVRPGQEIDIYGVLIEALKSNGSFSYRFSMRDSSFFVSPNATEIDNVLDLENRVNLAFMSVSSESNLEQVVRNAVKIKPEGVIPYLYDDNRSLEGLKAELKDRNIRCKLGEKSRR